MVDAQKLEKTLDYLDNVEIKRPLVLTYQPPPITITLEPGTSFEDVSEAFKKKIFEASRKGLSSMLQQCDDAIREQRPRGMFHNQHLETKNVASWCGEIPYRRTAYVDREGNNRYLCDEVLGLEQRQRISLNILLRALAAAGTMSYARVAQQIEQWTGLRRSPETCRRWVLRVGDSIQACRRKKCAAIFETPTSCRDDFPQKDPELLFLEADGCYIYMRVPPKKSQKQRASAKKEVYLGLYYEGKRPRRGTTGNGQYEVIGKTYFGGLMGVDEFWDTAAMMGYELWAWAIYHSDWRW